ncbi:MAG: VirB8/TrbF family protein [Alphaproteobacteria bacterium]|jgi:type IV secretory pathway component VirB8|nr:type IV secretion system protein [Candidatus Jidaibacter sp.]
MDNEKREIDALVKSGEYFKKAKDFYATMYLYPIVMRVQILVLVIILLASAYIAVTAFIRDYSDIKLPFPIYAIDQVQYYPNIKPLAEDAEPVEFSISRYLAEQYVFLRENYSYQDFDKENRSVVFEAVRAMSSKKVFREYMDYIDPEINTDSPILVYKNRAKRTVSIESTEMKSVNGQLVGVDIIFVSAVKGAGYDNQERYKASLEFYLNELEAVKRKEEKLEFLITKYQTYKLSN